MKFAHTFNETLSSENFPPEWQAAAIQYRQLKKCIKRLQRELDELGLSVETLKSLICECRDQGCGDGGNGGHGPMLQYMFDGADLHFSNGSAQGRRDTSGGDGGGGGGDRGVLVWTLTVVRSVQAICRVSSPGWY